MQLLQRFLDFYIKSSIHIGFEVFALVQITKMSLNNYVFTQYDIFIFFATILGYNFLKYSHLFSIKFFTQRAYFEIIIVTFFSGILAFFSFIKLESNIQVAIIKVFFMVLFYPLIRKYWYLKIVIVAACIAYITTFIPLINQEIKILNHWILIIQRFFIILCLLIPFEISDIELDTKTILTLPQKIGIRKIKLLGYFLILLYLTLGFFIAISFIHCLIAVLISVFIYFSSPKRSKYYTTFWVESIPIFWWFLLIIF
jgi:hypothetical protein